MKRGQLYFLKGLFVLTVCLIVKDTYAQNPICGFNTILASQMQNDSSVSRKINEVNDLISEEVDIRSTFYSGSRAEKKIAVVIHIVRSASDEFISDERILSQIERLNLDFNGENVDIDNIPYEFKSLASKDKGVRFCLATKDFNGNPTSGIVRVETNVEEIGIKEELYYDSLGGSSAWDTNKYLNIWVADMGTGILGFGTYPNQVDENRQGVVINTKFFGENNSSKYSYGRTLVHEIGHFLGLDHTWGSTTSCDFDDGVGDTPYQSTSYTNCPEYPQYSCESNDLYMNFMDYVDDHCMVMFTQGQMDRMKVTIDLFRSDLISQEECLISNENTTNGSFIISPNPNNGIFQIVSNDLIRNLSEIEIYNAVGELVYKEKSIVYDRLIFEIDHLQSGMYWLRIGNQTKRLIILGTKK